MAKLSTEDRSRIVRGLQRYWSNLWELVDSSSDELATTIDETDDWIDDNQLAYVQSLTHRTSYTAVQLTLIFCCVALMRVDPGLGRLLRAALSVEVD